jgi:hypothetical protein
LAKAVEGLIAQFRNELGETPSPGSQAHRPLPLERGEVILQEASAHHSQIPKLQSTPGEPPPPYPLPPEDQEEGGATPHSVTRSRQSEISVIATGGLAKLMAPLCPSIQGIEENLTLEGLLIAARRWAEAS